MAGKARDKTDGSTFTDIRVPPTCSRAVRQAPRLPAREVCILLGACASPTKRGMARVSQFTSTARQPSSASSWKRAREDRLTAGGSHEPIQRRGAGEAGGQKRAWVSYSHYHSHRALHVDSRRTLR